MIFVFLFSSINLGFLKIKSLNIIFNENPRKNTLQYLNDSFANEIIFNLSHDYTNGSHALGAPDNQFAKIFEGYDNGAIILDMGYYEEIVNQFSYDFRVIAREGGYRVRISNNLSTFPIDIGTGLGNQSFDLNSIGYESVRYIIIEYKNGSYVELDAIEAYHITEIEIEKNSPSIEEKEDFWIWENQSNIEISWLVYDENPWNYSIFVNDSLVETEEWNSQNVNFIYEIQSSGNFNISLCLYDLFGNYQVENVNVEIREITSPIPTRSSYSFILVVFTYFFFLIFLILKKKKKNK